MLVSRSLAKVLALGFLVVVMVLQLSIVSSGEYKVIGRDTISDILKDKLYSRGIHIAESIPSSIRVLPDIPNAKFHIVYTRDYGETYVLFFNEIKLSDNIRVSTNDISGPSYGNLDLLVDKVFGEFYTNILNHFYALLGSMKNGVEPNTYDHLRVPGLKELDVPTNYYRAREIIDPALSLVLVGFYDAGSNKTYGPLIIYYIAFETRATLESGLPARVLLVYTLVYDPVHILYKNEYTVGYVTHVILGKTGFGSIISFMNALAVYGGLGVFATVLSIVVKPSEHEKYAGLVIGYFALQALSIFIAVRIMGISMQSALEAAIQLGHWLHILAFLWFPAYLLASYYYGISYLTITSVEETSVRQLIGLAVSMMIAIILLFITIAIPDRVLIALTAYLGYNALFIFMILLSGLIAFVGIQLGLLSARMRFIRTVLTRV